MSHTYRLRDDGYPTFKKIMNGKKWVGRVVKHHTEPVYLGIIGQTTVRNATEEGAFAEVVARHLGHRNAEALHATNALVRTTNRVRRQRNKELARRFMQGDLTEKIAVIDAIFDNFEEGVK